MDAEQPLVIIVGPTASGKTAVAIDIAKRYDGEIICADSRTIYKEMDIGTAKPSFEERKNVPHFGLDIVTPGERFTVADFKSYALEKISEIRSRGHIPVLVGGTGLYVDSILFDFDFSETADRTDDWRKNPLPNAIVVGIATKKQILRKRIEARAEQLFTNGVVEEATRLGKKYGWDNAAMTGNIYPLIRDYCGGRLKIEECIEKFTTQDWQLAKRQMTWLRPNPFIEWCDLSEVRIYVDSRLASEQNL